MIPSIALHPFKTLDQNTYTLFFKYVEERTKRTKLSHDSHEELRRDHISHTYLNLSASKRQDYASPSKKKEKKKKEKYLNYTFSFLANRVKRNPKSKTNLLFSTALFE